LFPYYLNLLDLIQRNDYNEQTSGRTNDNLTNSSLEETSDEEEEENGDESDNDEEENNGDDDSV
jgi:hypothetical protein